MTALPLVAAARAFLHSEECPGLAPELNLDALLELAEQHGMGPLVYRAYGGEEMRAQFEQHARGNLAQTAELLRLLDLLEGRGIPAIPLKGPVLAQWGYGSLALRAFADLDLLVPRDRVADAARLLLASGYRLTSRTHSSGDAALLKFKDAELSLEREDAGVCLDLHWRLLPRHFADSLSPRELWDDLITLNLAGRPVRTLGPETLLLFLCAHGGKHRWERLGWICDVAVTIRRAEIDWKRLIAEARQAKVHRMLLLGLRLARDLFEVSLPPEVSKVVDEDRHVGPLCSNIRERLLTPAPSGSPFLRCWLNLRMLDRFRDRVRFLFELVITPGEAEWRELRLSPALYFLYFPHRLLRLAAKHVTPWAKRRLA